MQMIKVKKIEKKQQHKLQHTRDNSVNFMSPQKQQNALEAKNKTNQNKLIFKEMRNVSKGSYAQRKIENNKFPFVNLYQKLCIGNFYAIGLILICFAQRISFSIAAFCRCKFNSNIFWAVDLIGSISLQERVDISLSQTTIIEKGNQSKKDLSFLLYFLEICTLLKKVFCIQIRQSK